MFTTKYFLTFFVCHVLSLCLEINGGGGYARRLNNKYNLGWNENDNNNNNINNNNNNNVNYQDQNQQNQNQGNYSPPQQIPHQPIPYHDDNRYEFDNTNTMAMKKAFGLTKLIISPVVIPAIIFVGIVLLLFFAVVGSSAVVGGSFGRRVPYEHTMFAKSLSDTAKMASDVLGSEECVERISCEVFRKAKGFQAENWFTRTLQLIPMKPNWMNRISRSIKSKSACQEFYCPSVSRISRTIKLLH